MRQFILSVPAAIVAGLALVAFAAIITTAPGPAGLLASQVLAAVALFGAIVTVGAAVRRQRRSR